MSASKLDALVEKIRQPLEEKDMYLRYFLHLLKPLLRAFAKSFAIFGAIFGVMIIGYGLASLLFYSFWTTTILFLAAVGWGTYFNFTEGQIDLNQGPLQEYYASEHAAAVTHSERIGGVDGGEEEEEILGA